MSFVSAWKNDARLLSDALGYTDGIYAPFLQSVSEAPLCPLGRVPS